MAMSKALNFIHPDELSATVVLTALNSFLHERHGSKMAFLDGPPTVRMCEPIVEFIKQNGGAVFLNKPIRRIILKGDGSVSTLETELGEMVHADAYISTMAVDPLKLMVPQEWKSMPFFQKVVRMLYFHLFLYVKNTAVMVALLTDCDGVVNKSRCFVLATAKNASILVPNYYAFPLPCFVQLDGLFGVPVINIHLWFDRKLTTVDHVLFSKSPLLSVYADMSLTCKGYHNDERSMLELVFAPAKDYIGRPDEEVSTYISIYVCTSCCEGHLFCHFSF